MFVEVVLQRRLPRNLESLTYAVPAGLSVRPGQLVTVPLKKQTLPAVVRKIHGEEPRYSTRPISEILDSGLTHHQLNLAEWMTEFYGCSFSRSAGLFLPEKVWTGQKSAEEEMDTSKTRIKGSRHRKMITPLRLGPGRFFFLEASPHDREYLLQQIAAGLSKNSQILILMPEVAFLENLAETITAYSGNLSEGKKAAIWRAVRDGKISMIAGTRAALFLPFKNLSLIVLAFEENESYREKRSPHYHGLEVAEKLAEILDIPLVVTSACPRVETWRRLEEGAFQKIESEPAAKRSVPRIEVVNMADERRKGVVGPLSEKVLEKTAEVLAQGGQVLLFADRAGTANALYCHDCREVVRCEGCHAPLRIQNGRLSCHRCHQELEIPAACPYCRGLKLKPLGAGTEKFESEMRRRFEKARVIRLDRLSIREGIPSDDLKRADIIVATRLIEKPLSLPRLKLIACPAVDSLLNLPDFRAEERLFQLLIHLRQLLRVSDGLMLIQTHLSEHKLHQRFAGNEIEAFYQNELEVRKSLSLPPFSGQAH